MIVFFDFLDFFCRFSVRALKIGCKFGTPGSTFPLRVRKACFHLGHTSNLCFSKFQNFIFLKHIFGFFEIWNFWIFKIHLEKAWSESPVGLRNRVVQLLTLESVLRSVLTYSDMITNILPGLYFSVLCFGTTIYILRVYFSTCDKLLGVHTLPRSLKSLLWASTRAVY